MTRHRFTLQWLLGLAHWRHCYLRYCRTGLRCHIRLISIVEECAADRSLKCCWSDGTVFLVCTFANHHQAFLLQFRSSEDYSTRTEIWGNAIISKFLSVSQRPSLTMTSLAIATFAHTPTPRPRLHSSTDY